MLAEEILDGATEETLVGIISAPSVFVKIQELKVCSYFWKGRSICQVGVSRWLLILIPVLANLSKIRSTGSRKDTGLY